MHRNLRPTGLDDSAVARLLAGRAVDEDARLAEFVAAVRATYATDASVAPNARLTAVMKHGVERPDRPSVSASPPAKIPARLARRRVRTALGAFFATLTGKIVLGAAVAAASVGGAHAAGVADIPGLPDRPSQVEATAGHAPEGVPAPGSHGQGVDGSGVSERARSGEPQTDGRAFGSSIADEAVSGTAAEALRGSGPEEPPAPSTDGRTQEISEDHTPVDGTPATVDTNGRGRPSGRP